MHVVVDPTEGVVRKHAETPGDRRRLAREAAVLRIAAHPGVVQIAGSEGDGEPETLVLREVKGSALTEECHLDAPKLTRVGAALATTVADLHDIGVVHSSLIPSHVLIDETDAPVLCGFGSARYAAGAEDFDARRREDIAALARLLMDAIGDVVGPKCAALLRSAADGRRRPGFRGKAVDARIIAGTLAHASSALTPVDRGDDRRRRSRVASWQRAVHRSRHSPGTVLAGAAVVGGITAAAALWPASTGSPAVTREHRHAVLSSEVEPCPAQDQGCVAVAPHGGVIGSGYRIVGASGTIVVGRWDCLAIATPALLDPRTGNVWVFDSWPSSGEKTAARLAATVPGASDLKVLPPAIGSSCDRIEVRRRDRPPLVANPLDRAEPARP